MALLLLGVSGVRWKRRCALPAAGPDRAAPGYRGGDIVSAFPSRDAGAVGEPALARPDDDGAPPPVTWPRQRQPRPRRDPPGSLRAGGAGWHRPRQPPPPRRPNRHPPGSAPVSAHKHPPASAASQLRPRAHQRGAVDGGWWPHSRNAPAELPGLIAALDSRPGARVQRLSVHRDDWDDIPHRLTTDHGHRIRVDWFTIIPRHTISVTTAGKEPIELLVFPRHGRRHRPDRPDHGSHRPRRHPGRCHPYRQSSPEPPVSMTRARASLTDGDQRAAGDEHRDLACHQPAGRGPRLAVQALRDRWRQRPGRGALSFVEPGADGQLAFRLN